MSLVTIDKVDKFENGIDIVQYQIHYETLVEKNPELLLFLVQYSRDSAGKESCTLRFGCRGEFILPTQDAAVTKAVRGRLEGMNPAAREEIFGRIRPEVRRFLDVYDYKGRC